MSAATLLHRSCQDDSPLAGWGAASPLEGLELPLTPQDILARLCEIYDCDNLIELSDKLGHKEFPDSVLYKWNRYDGRRNAPDFKNTIRLLELGGFLNTDGAQKRRPPRNFIVSEVLDEAEELVRLLDSGSSVPDARLERVAAEIDRLSAAYRRLAGRLRRGLPPSASTA